jgi:hypothetical protein
MKHPPLEHLILSGAKDLLRNHPEDATSSDLAQGRSFAALRMRYALLRTR